ncbi:unnamed protein product [Peniophora sp. CBMAI 1063]|nr:unnamed protein product [Peniophora sp. CBMAI 1063]
MVPIQCAKCRGPSWKPNTCTHCTPFFRLSVDIQIVLFSLLAVVDPPSTPQLSNYNKSGYVPPEDDASTAQQSLRRGNASGITKGSLGFVRLSHVCKTWRDILLSMKRVWADNIGVLPLATSDMLVRAGACPLTVTLCQDTNLDVHGLPVNRVAEAPIVRAVHGILLKPRSATTEVELTHLLHVLFPYENTLERMDISIMSPDKRSILDDQSSTTLLHPLSLRNLFITPPRSSLRHLSITFEAAGEESDATFDEVIGLLDMLQCCGPTLRNLELIHCYVEGMTPEGDPINLPVLQQLVVGGSPRTLFDVTEFAYPSTCDVAIHDLGDEVVLNGPPGTPGTIFHHALRSFSDEIIARTGSYGFVFNTLPGENNFVSVRALSSTSLAGRGELFVDLPDIGQRRLYFDTLFMEDLQEDIFSPLSRTLETDARDWDPSALNSVEVVSVVRTDNERCYQKKGSDDARFVFSQMSALRVLHLQGVDDQIIKDVCYEFAGERGGEEIRTLPSIQVLRLSPGYSGPPINLNRFCIRLAHRFVGDLDGERPRPLASLIVDAGVQFNVGIEKQMLMAQWLKLVGAAEKVYWNEYDICVPESE